MDFSDSFFQLREKANNLEQYNENQLVDLINEANAIKEEYHNMELVVKADANSIYGVSASDYFSLVDYDVAEDITCGGKHYMIIVDMAINNLFVTWDTPENLKIVQEFYPNCIGIKNNILYKADSETDLCVYGDTDSRYIDFGQIYDFIDGVEFPENTKDGNKELSEFVIFVMNRFLNNVIEVAINEEMEYRNHRKGYLIMEHEITARKSDFQKKKKYVCTMIWKDGKLLSDVKLKVTGVELKKGELNPRMKKILTVLVNKFLIEDYDENQLKTECLKIIQYIKSKKDKEFIYRISSVSKLKQIYKTTDNVYKSDLTHIQMKIAISWMNFIEKNNLQNEYKFPFERQKMNYYYDVNGNVIGIPDDINMNNIKGLPEPDWNLMINQVLIKPLLKYIYDDDMEFDDEACQLFLLGVQRINI